MGNFFRCSLQVQMDSAGGIRKCYARTDTIQFSASQLIYIYIHIDRYIYIYKLLVSGIIQDGSYQYSTAFRKFFVIQVFRLLHLRYDAGAQPSRPAPESFTNHQPAHPISSSSRVSPSCNVTSEGPIGE